MSTDRISSTQIFSVHYLRGIAAWAVVFHHYTQIFYEFRVTSGIGIFFAKHGDLGVDLFFIISGFIINFNFLHKSPGPIGFAIDRITRIAPAYWVATGILVLVIDALGTPLGSLFQWDPETLALSLLFIPHENLSGIGLYPILTVGWTLNFELFFYTLFFFSIVVFQKYPGILCLIIMLSVAITSYFDIIDGFYANWLYLLEFSFGIVLSFLFTQYQTHIVTLSTLLRMLIVLVLIAGAVRSLQLQYPGHQFAFSAAIVITGLLLEVRLGRLRGKIVRILHFMGNISYSLYLYHVIVLFVALHTIGAHDNVLGQLAVLIGICVAITLIAWLSYRLIEVRLRRQLRTLLLLWRRS